MKSRENPFDDIKWVQEPAGEKEMWEMWEKTRDVTGVGRGCYANEWGRSKLKVSRESGMIVESRCGGPGRGSEVM